MSQNASTSLLAPQPHSILKKTHPASLSPTPRSRSPVSFRDGSSSNGSGSGSVSAAGESQSPSENFLGLDHITPTTPMHPSPLRSEALASTTDDEFSASAMSPISAAPSQIVSAPADISSHGAPLPSILRSSSSYGQGEEVEQFDSDRHSPQQNVKIYSDAGGASPRGPLLQLPSGLNSADGSVTPAPSASVNFSDSSKSADRTRIVGRGGYGGRRGGPTLNKNRTSSSGGLSDIDMRPGYERKVGFDTMIDADDTPNGHFSFCLQVKSRGYLRTKNTRTFMCAVDDNGYSERALEWLMDSLASDGDEIVAVRVLEGDPDEIDQDAAREEARELMASIVELNDEYGDRSISIVVEFVAGRVTSTIMGLIYMYRPDSITVGTRGRSVSAFHKMLGASFIGSCSRDILNTSPVPVVIVRPEAKVKKHLAKRQNDPKRRSYHDLVALSKEDHLPLSVGGSKRSGTHSHLSVPRHR